MAMNMRMVTSMRRNMLSFASTTTVNLDTTARGRGRPRHTGMNHTICTRMSQVSMNMGAV